jgi:hypothetical protein
VFISAGRTEKDHHLQEALGLAESGCAYCLLYGFFHRREFCSIPNFESDGVPLTKVIAAATATWLFW